MPQRGTAAVLRWPFPWTMLSASEGCAPRAQRARAAALRLREQAGQYGWHAAAIQCRTPPGTGYAGSRTVHNVKFVPFSLEAGGVWGPAAKKFFKQCASQADNQDRDVDLYHWSSAKFESTWRDTISVLVARGRAQVGVHSAKSDWSRRILDFAYMDYDDQAAHHE